MRGPPESPRGRQGRVPRAGAARPLRRRRAPRVRSPRCCIQRSRARPRRGAGVLGGGGRFGGRLAKCPRSISPWPSGRAAARAELGLFGEQVERQPQLIVALVVLARVPHVRGQLGVQTSSSTGSAPGAPSASASRWSATARPASNPSPAAAAAARSTSARAVSARSAASGTRSHSERALEVAQRLAVGEHAAGSEPGCDVPERARQVVRAPVARQLGGEGRRWEVSEQCGVGLDHPASCASSAVARPGAGPRKQPRPRGLDGTRRSRPDG